MKKLLLPIALIILSCSPEDDCKTTPKLTTSEAESITDVSAVISGTVTPPCDETVTSQGFVYGEENLPTIDDIVIVKSGSDISASLSNLKQNTTYYVRTFFENPTGVYYGNEIVFNTNIGDAVMLTETAIPMAQSAIILGRLLNSGGGAILEMGVCYSKTENPTIDNNKTISEKTSIGQFSIEVTALEAETKYFYKIYAINESGVFYGEEKNFRTLDGIIELTTKNVINIKALSASSGGIISSNGGSEIYEYGLETSKTIDFIESEKKWVNGSIENFDLELDNLTNNTRYYLRSYATNGVGTFYGNTIQFTTKSGIAELSVDKLFNITTISAVSKISIIDDGGIEKETFGICWSLNPNPTINDSFSYSNNTDVYTILKGMLPNKNYYVRAFLNNQIGTSYSQEYQIQTLSSLNVGDIFEDGVVVHIVPQESEYYNEGMVNGLIARTSYREESLAGYNLNTSSEYGSGLNNTLEIMNEAYNSGNSSIVLAYVGAINLCNGEYFSDLNQCGATSGWYYYDEDKTYDWFIPSLDEMKKLYENYDLIKHKANGSPAYLNGIASTYHWTSTAVNTSPNRFYRYKIDTGYFSPSKQGEDWRLIVTKYF
jgi:hypothetical protein